MTSAVTAGPGTRMAVRLGLAVALLVAGCGPSVPAPSPSPSARPSPDATPSARPTPGTTPSSAPPSAPPDAPAGTAWVEVPEAGIRVPVPVAWDRVPPEDVLDPGRRAELEQRYPGAVTLLGQADRLGDWADPVLLAVDPSTAAEDAFTANMSVLATGTAVSGPLLDFVAGFIADGIAETLGAPSPAREKVDLPAGEAVRLDFDVPPDDAGRPVEAVAWVIGTPGATVLVTLMGGQAVLADLDPDAIAGAIVPLPVEVP